MSIGNIGNNTECFGNKCQRNKDKPCVIHHGENRFFSKDKFWNNCFRCHTEKEVICMRSNGDEVKIFCGECNTKVQSKKMRFLFENKQMCVNCALKPGTNVLSPDHIPKPPNVDDSFIDSFQEIFHELCQINDVRDFILSNYEIKIKICYFSNFDEENACGGEQTDDTEDKKGFIRIILLVFIRKKIDLINETHGEWILFVSMKLEYFDSSFESSTRICNQNTCHLSLLDSVRLEDKLMDKDIRKLFIYILLSTSVQWGRDNLGTQVYSFWALAPSFKGISYMLYSAEISRITHGKKDHTGTPQAQEHLTKFYEGFVDFLLRNKLIEEKTTLAEVCRNNCRDDNGDFQLFCYIYAGDFVSSHFFRGKKRFYNIWMTKTILNSLIDCAGVNEQSFVLKLTSPDITEFQKIENIFPISQKTKWGIDQSLLINFVRRNHLGFAEQDMQIQTTQLIIRYLIDNNLFYIRRCCHCWAFLTLPELRTCNICKQSDNWPRGIDALICEYCSKTTSNPHKGITEKLMEEGLLLFRGTFRN